MRNIDGTHPIPYSCLHSKGKRTNPEAVLYDGLYLYCPSLSLRQGMWWHMPSIDPIVKRSHVAVWKWIDTDVR